MGMSDGIHNRVPLQRQEAISTAEVGCQTDLQGIHHPIMFGEAVQTVVNIPDTPVNPNVNATPVKMIKAGVGAMVTGGVMALIGHYGESLMCEKDKECTAGDGLVGAGVVMATGGVVTAMRGAYRFVTGSQLSSNVVDALDTVKGTADKAISNKINKTA